MSTITQAQFDKLHSYLKHDQQIHMRAPHKRWTLDAGKLETALACAYITINATPHVDKLTAIVLEFIDNIDVSGGVIAQNNGLHHLATDHDWIDLAETYLDACRVLHRPAIVAHVDDPEIEDESPTDP